MLNGYWKAVSIDLLVSINCYALLRDFQLHPVVKYHPSLARDVAVLQLQRVLLVVQTEDPGDLLFGAGG